MITILTFILILFILVLVHEWGHFIVAKKTGMRVDEFGIGFPPKLFGRVWHGTEYTLNLLPIGGFVRIYGEDAADAAGDAAEGVVVSDAFTSKSKWAQAAVLLAGVTMNILFAWALFVMILMIGTPTPVDSATSAPNAHLMITQVEPSSPAAAAGIPIGAKVTKLHAADGAIDTVTADNFSNFTDTHPNVPIDITYTIAHHTYTKTVTPKTGLITSDPTRPAIGVAISYVATVRESLGTALKDATVMTYNAIVTIAVSLSLLVWHAVHGTANFAQVAGPVGLVSLVGTAEQIGFTSVVMFTAMISLNLAVINVLPFPALDGGRLLFVAIEAIIRRPIDPVWTARVNAIGFSLLMILMVVITYHDIVKHYTG